ncbi:MAG: TetR/AcrR family transcriptional regulator [Casimicrobium sp.]
MKQTETKLRRKTGRPLSFDREAALHQAMLLFWRHGYESTSLNDLTVAMGVTPPSIYAAFGDKKQLFRESVRRYLSGTATPTTIIDGASTARQAVWDLLKASAIAFTSDDLPRGCLLASSTISCSAAATDLQAELAGIRRQIEACLKNKIVCDVSAGNLPNTTDASAIAGHVMAVIQGMSTLARDGASRSKLVRVAQTAMRALPEKD